MENDNEKKTPLPDDDNKEDQQKPAKKDDKLDLKNLQINQIQMKSTNGSQKESQVLHFEIH